MALVYGYTPLGFVKKPPDQVSSEIDGDLQGILGKSAGTNADGTIPLDSMAGQLKVMLADGFNAFWDIQQAAAASVNRASASGASLDVIGALTGAIRDAQGFSTALCALAGTAPAVLLAGRVATVTTTASRFDLEAPSGSVTLAALAAWAQNHAYSVGQMLTNGGNAYVCTVSGTSLNTGGGPSGTGTAIVDNTVTWAFVGAGAYGLSAVTFQAEQPGPIGATQGQLVTIGTPVDGWTGVYNYVAAQVGALVEADPAYRQRQNEELAGEGAASTDAIRSAILRVNQGSTDPNHQPPTACTVFANRSDSTDVNGLPPHSVEVMVVGGTDADIAQAVWNVVAGGTATHGNQTSTVTDSQGNPQTVYWTRPVAVPIYLILTVDYDPTVWTGANAAASVATAVLSTLLTYGAAIEPGVDVRYSPLLAACLLGPSATDQNGNAIVAPTGSSSVAGLVEVSSLVFGTAPSPSTTTTVVVGSRGVASFLANNISITATPETP